MTDHATGPLSPEVDQDAGPGEVVTVHYTGSSLPEGQMEVEIEVEVTRREKRRFTVDVSDGMSTSGATWETGRFWRAVNYWMHQPRDLGKRESATLVGLRFIQPCQPENLFGDHEYEPIPNSDQAARCKRCGRVTGK